MDLSNISMGEEAALKERKRKRSLRERPSRGRLLRER